MVKQFGENRSKKNIKSGSDLGQHPIIEKDIFPTEEIAKAEHKASIISKRVKVENKRPQKAT